MTVPEKVLVKELQIDKELTEIASAIDQFEGYANPHASRIAVLADAVAQEFNLASQDRFSLQQAAMVHDIGELLMDRDYIKTNRVLNQKERMDMQRHPVIGEHEAAKRGLDRAVQLIVRWHHEWWNGLGYPDGLSRDQIPLAARIIRVSDTYAALTDSRPYSVPISSSEAHRYISEWAGIEFDPRVVKVFLSLKDIPELRSYSDKTE